MLIALTVVGHVHHEVAEQWSASEAATFLLVYGCGNTASMRGPSADQKILYGG